MDRTFESTVFSRMLGRVFPIRGEADPAPRKENTAEFSQTNTGTFRRLDRRARWELIRTIVKDSDEPAVHVRISASRS